MFNLIFNDIGTIHKLYELDEIKKTYYIRVNYSVHSMASQTGDLSSTGITGVPPTAFDLGGSWRPVVSTSSSSYYSNSVASNCREWMRQEELGRDPEEALGDDTQFYLQGW